MYDGTRGSSMLPRLLLHKPNDTIFNASGFIAMGSAIMNRIRQINPVTMERIERNPVTSMSIPGALRRRRGMGG